MTYDEKRQARIDRYRNRATLAASQSSALWEKAHQMAAVIPFGQPILIGHQADGVPGIAPPGQAVLWSGRDAWDQPREGMTMAEDHIHPVNLRLPQKLWDRLWLAVQKEQIARGPSNKFSINQAITDAVAAWVDAQEKG
ncbi:MAG: DUF3560 domain-containing protein [Desulfarculus sp.]|nr:DUF3560 domain-containing protein [Desulfarculus sp.]